MSTYSSIQKHLRNSIGCGVSVSNLRDDSSIQPTFTTEDAKYTYKFTSILLNTYMKIMDKIGNTLIFRIEEISVQWVRGDEDAIIKMIDDVKSEVLYNKHHNI